MTYQNDPAPGTRSNLESVGPTTGRDGGPQPRDRSGGVYAMVGAAIIAALVAVAFMMGAFDRGGSAGTGASSGGGNIPNATSTNPPTRPRVEGQPASPGTSGPQTNPAPVR